MGAVHFGQPLGEKSIHNEDGYCVEACPQPQRLTFDALCFGKALQAWNQIAKLLCLYFPQNQKYSNAERSKDTISPRPTNEKQRSGLFYLHYQVGRKSWGILQKRKNANRDSISGELRRSWLRAKFIRRHVPSCKVFLQTQGPQNPWGWEVQPSRAWLSQCHPTLQTCCTELSTIQFQPSKYR